MTQLSGRRWLQPGDRMHPTVRDLTILSDAIWLAGCVALQDGFKRPSNPLGWTYLSRQFSTAVTVPINGPIVGIVRGESERTAYEVGFGPHTQPPPSDLHKAGNMTSVHALLFKGAFMLFFESQKRFIRARFGMHPKGWASLFRFIWAMRNAIAHDDSSYNMDDPNAAPVTWHHIKFDHNDYGKPIYPTVLGPGDLLLLMFEVADEMDRLELPLR